MIHEVKISVLAEGSHAAPASERGAALERVRREFRGVPVVGAERPLAAGLETIASRRRLIVAAPRWQDPSFDLRAYDDKLDRFSLGGPMTLCVEASPRDLDRVAIEVLTRSQRALVRPSASASGSALDALVDPTSGLFDDATSVGRALRRRAMDTWRWLLRLHEDASVATQAAALLCDVGRLASEGHYLPADDVARALARLQRAWSLLDEGGVRGSGRRRVRDLLDPCASREADVERGLLDDAQALSFLSLGSAGYLDAYGSARTSRKMAQAVGRLCPAARRCLGTIRYRPDVASLLRELVHVRPRGGSPRSLWHQATDPQGGH